VDQLLRVKTSGFVESKDDVTLFHFVVWRGFRRRESLTVFYLLLIRAGCSGDSAPCLWCLSSWPWKRQGHKKNGQPCKRRSRPQLAAHAWLPDWPRSRPACLGALPWPQGFRGQWRNAKHRRNHQLYLGLFRVYVCMYEWRMMNSRRRTDGEKMRTLVSTNKIARHNNNATSWQEIALFSFYFTSWRKRILAIHIPSK
jgi:hypothetical protein